MITLGYQYQRPFVQKALARYKEFCKEYIDANLVCILGNDIIESQEKQGAWVAELVDARDLKSLGACLCASSILAPGTSNSKGFSRVG